MDDDGKMMGDDGRWWDAFLRNVDELQHNIINDGRIILNQNISIP